MALPPRGAPRRIHGRRLTAFFAGLADLLIALRVDESFSAGESGLAQRPGHSPVSVWSLLLRWLRATATRLLGPADTLSVGLNQPVSLRGSSRPGTVTLSGPASSYGATVNLSSSATAGHRQQAWTVASGAQQRDFLPVNNQYAVTGQHPCHITAPIWRD